MNKEKRLVTIIRGNGHPMIAKRINPQRNTLCNCGSGKKVKHCHGVDTNYYSRKPKEELGKPFEK